MYILKDITKSLENIVNYNFEIKYSRLPDGQDQFKFIPKPGIDNTVIMQALAVDVVHYLQLNPLRGFLEAYQKQLDYYKPRTLLLFYANYLIGWLYVLIKGILYYTQLS